MNGNILNMFTAKKIKLHGMKSSKWTTQDKIIQYKGLINLYTRDKKIIDSDTNVNRRKIIRELKDIAKSVYTDRRALDNAIRGDKQNLRNILSEHKKLQLAYQNSQPKKVIDQLDQRIFSNRKKLDKILYEKTLKSKKLENLKLEQALLDDRLKYEVLREIKQEKEAQIITGKVNDATLRKEAAWCIHQIYKEILDIMRKDALYFDVIIATVSNDGYSQSKCFLGATKLGQLATEYLDDRRQEYNTLERIILKDLTTRKTDIRILREQIENANAGIKLLLRKDSDITTCTAQIKDVINLDEINRDVKQAQKSLNILKDSTAVPSFSAIFHCLEEQARQNERLKKMVRKCETDKDMLLNKKNHAEAMNAVLKTTVTDDMKDYLEQKREYLAQLESNEHEQKFLEKQLRYKKDVAAKIRIALRQLLQISYNIKPPEMIKTKSAAAIVPLTRTESKTMKFLDIPQTEEQNGVKIINILTTKLGVLMTSYWSKQRDYSEDYFLFESMMQQRMHPIKGIEVPLSAMSLIGGLYTMTSHQLTREDIKKQSQEIVAANTKTDDIVPIVTKSKTKKMKLVKH